MINKVTLSNFGCIENLTWDNLGPINLIIGENGAGKTFLLKALYTSIRTLEEYKRGDDNRTLAEVLSDKLYWTFQPDKIGDMVKKGANEPLSCAITIDGKEFSYRFGKDTKRKISDITNKAAKPEHNSIFLPAKEVLSLHHIILQSREQDKSFGFDDTYFDLAKALRIPTSKGKNFKDMANSRKDLNTMIGGKIEYDEQAQRWQFKKGNQKYPIGLTPEGIRKISILDTLLGNRYLSSNSIVFFDEPESALHPTAIATLLDIVAMLSKKSCNIQFFISSHSYFVVKKLFLIAKKHNMSIPFLAYDNGSTTKANLLDDGIPDNAIINESIRLYEEEIDLVL